MRRPLAGPYLSKAYMRLRDAAGTISANMGLLHAGPGQLFMTPKAINATACKPTVAGLAFCGRPCNCNCT